MRKVIKIGFYLSTLAMLIGVYFDSTECLLMVLGLLFLDSEIQDWRYRINSKFMDVVTKRFDFIEQREAFRNADLLWSEPEDLPDPPSEE
jgi:hypothetical protein